jgi:hypothetical protein
MGHRVVEEVEVEIRRKFSFRSLLDFHVNLLPVYHHYTTEKSASDICGRSRQILPTSGTEEDAARRCSQGMTMPVTTSVHNAGLSG